MEEPFLKPIPVDQLANRDAIRKHTVRGLEQVKVPFENITTRPGFNERTDWTGIEELALSILDDGLLFPIWIDMLLDGTCILIDGERRYKAIEYLRSQGHDYAHVAAIIAPKGWTDIDRLFFMAQANNGGKPFDDIELGRVFVRLVNMGISQAEISKRMGNMSEMVVGNRIVAAKLTDREKKSVEEGEISLTAAVAYAKREKNPAIRQATIKEAALAGKKVQVKDVLEKVKKQSIPETIQQPQDFDKPIFGQNITPEQQKEIMGRATQSGDAGTLKVELSKSHTIHVDNSENLNLPDWSERAKGLVSDCLGIIKTLNSFLEPGNLGEEYTNKLANKLRELKQLLS